MGSRREFLKKTTLTGAGITLGGPALVNAAGKQTKSVKIPIFAFSKHFQFMEDFGELSDFMLEAGLNGLDLTVRPGGHVEPEQVEEILPGAVAAMKKRGLYTPMIVTKIGDPEDPLTDRILKAANKEDIRYYRMAYYNYAEDLGIEKNLERFKKDFKALSGINKKYNIHGAYQNHTGTRLGAPIWDLFQSLEGLNPEWIGCQYDIRHAMAEGGNSWPLTWQLIKPFVKCVDVKDFRWEKVKGKWKDIHVPLGEGMVDFEKFFGYLREFEFAGPISLHIEYPMYDLNDTSLTYEQKRKAAMKNLKHDMVFLKEKLSESGLI